MKPIEFPEKNIVFAENQKDYLPLPAFRADDENGTVVTCWELTWQERIKIFFTGKLWWTQLTFGKKLQPQLPSVFKWDTLNKEFFKKQKAEKND